MEPILRKFIKDNAKADVQALLLKHSKRSLGFDLNEAVTQIEARKRTRRKLPTFLANDDFRFPSLLAAEQASDERVAEYHASLVNSSETVFDMTAGLGIDAMSMAGKCKSVKAFEMDESKADALRENAATLGKDNLEVVNADSVEWLRTHPEACADVIFIDPARRGSEGERTYGFADCTPNVVSIMPLLLQHCKRIIIKASPMLDITQVLNELRHVSSIKAISLHGECKEVLAIVEKDADLQDIEAVMLPEQTSYKPVVTDLCEEALLQDESELTVGGYLYQPDASVMKLGRLANLTRQFEGLKKLHPNTQIYFSNELIADFPGRKMRIVEKPREKDLKKRRLNIVRRNYPMSAKEIQKKFKIADGGSEFLYAVRGPQRPTLLICIKD